MTDNGMAELQSERMLIPLMCLVTEYLTIYYAAMRRALTSP